MSNLGSIGKSIVLYKSQYNNEWPWIPSTGEWWNTPVGTNREVDPNKPAVERSITSLMFLLVRENQPTKLFVCPSDKSGRKDENPYKDSNSDLLAADFNDASNVGYSWQAPVHRAGKYVNGIDDTETDTVVVGDKTPLSDDAAWRPDDMTKKPDSGTIMRNMSQNHGKGEKVNVLYVGMNVVQVDRPDVGKDKDNIYTASGDANSGSQSGTSLDIRQHLSARDTFLIGPVKAK